MGSVLRAPILRGLAGAIVGFVLGAGTAGAIRVMTGETLWDTEVSWATGYPVALLGWLAGVGVWEHWGREWFGGAPQPYVLKGWQRYFGFSPDHKVIGIQYIVTFIVIFLLSGLTAMLLRIELAQSGMQLFTHQQYMAAMGFHGIAMVAVAVAILTGGFGNYLVPLMIGARDMAFPRLNALTYWLTPPVAVLLLIAVGMGGWDSGWTAYPPLSVVNANGQVLFNLAVITFGLVSILGGINFLVTVIYERAPGMTWFRMPIYVWGVFTASLISFFFTQALAAGLLMVLLDRIVGTSFFRTSEGGNPILYQHVFWFYSHPAVYVMVLPGFGAALEILAHMSRKPLFAYRWVSGAMVGIVLLSGIVWAHHMFTSGMAPYLHAPFLVLTELISIPTGFIFLSALGTIWAGKMWLQTPMLFALAFIFNFLIGGVTGIFLADVPSDVHLQDTYFIVAHFHYTIVGGEIFALFAAIYFWFPKFTGRQYSETLGKLHFWLMFLGFQLTFIPMFRVGIQGMNRRVSDYPAQYDGYNTFISYAAAIIGVSFIFFVWNMVAAWFRGRVAVANPWRARTLEWQVASPPPEHNFDEIPVITDGPYGYGGASGAHNRPFAGGAAVGAEGGQ